jgi:hypothetical protein
LKAAQSKVKRQQGVEKATMLFTVRLINGEEVHAREGDELSVNDDTGVISISRAEGFEEVTTYYSPSVWESVTHRVKHVGKISRIS